MKIKNSVGEGNFGQTRGRDNGQTRETGKSTRGGARAATSEFGRILSAKIDEAPTVEPVLANQIALRRVILSAH